jgi:N-acetyl sugar amidotransferase
MKYCKKCVLPDSRPNLELDEDGVCNACRSHGFKPKIDWDRRHSDFEDLVLRVRKLSRGYDCLIPVSGGKDSTWQTWMCLEAGLTPLAVTWATPARTEIGQRNLQNLIDLGVDHIDFRISPKVEKRFMLKAFEKYGSTALPMHMAIHAIPVQMAYRFDIPLIVYGENSAFEYGSSDESVMGHRLNSEWLKRFGVTHGTTAEDWEREGFTRKELSWYHRPSDEMLEEKDIRAVFLGHYYQWDPEQVKEAAAKQGFVFEKGKRRTGLYDYADIDDDFISIHHWMKWYKFGFTRLYDNLSLEIRNGRVSRDEAIEMIGEVGDQTPKEDIEKCCAFMGLSVDNFMTVAETFRNTDIWVKEGGTWKIPDFLIEKWSW